MDLLALADCLLQTEDDLSLAAVLKSPLIGLSEDDLFALAYGRETSLWQSLERIQNGLQRGKGLASGAIWRLR